MPSRNRLSYWAAHTQYRWGGGGGGGVPIAQWDLNDYVKGLSSLNNANFYQKNLLSIMMKFHPEGI